MLNIISRSTLKGFAGYTCRRLFSSPFGSASMSTRKASSYFTQIKQKILQYFSISQIKSMPSISAQELDRELENYIDKNDIVVFSKSNCPYCKKVKKLFESNGLNFCSVDLDAMENGIELHQRLQRQTAQRTVPNVFVKKLHIGGYDKTKEAFDSNALTKLLREPKHMVIGDQEQTYDYDLIVIGGGSGGLACVKEAASLGAKTCILDFVKPSPQGTTWGLGGTCVNVGCIPKKLMHYAALIGEILHEAPEFGWELQSENITHNWIKLKDGVDNHIRSLNFSYRIQLKKKNINYLNAFGEFVDAHTLKCTDKKGKVTQITGKNIVVAVGGRPVYPDIPGAKEFGISSDDIFWLSYFPGKTLIIGASYIALETAGFLNALGCDVTVMVRSILLRNFDQEMANKIGAYMETLKIKFIKEAIPLKIECLEKGSPGRLKVSYKYTANDEAGEDEYNTVLFAVGRHPCLNELKLDAIGVNIDPKSHKIITMNEKSSVDNIYGIGDCIRDCRMPSNRMLELTPVAIRAGLLLARRLFGSSTEQMDYFTVPTTVFTPLEYGSIGYSEEEAETLLREYKVYHNYLWPYEWTVPHKADDTCYVKLIVDKNEKVVGFHYLGPNAGEVTQGFATAMRMGATKKDFDCTVGIHPTCAESFTKLTVIKGGDEKLEATGC